MCALALAGAGLALLFLAAAWFGQRPVVFPAPPVGGRMGPGLAEPVRLDGPDGTYQALLLTPARSAPSPYPLVIFAHGNGELADHWVGEFEPVRGRGWGVLLLEYPGYGRAPGTPSEASIRNAARRVYDWAASDPRIDPTRIVAWGRSLGGGAAAWLAGSRPVAALILESSFTSVRPLAAKYLVPGWLVRDPFDNVEALREYRGPLLVLHGIADRIVPIEQGRALAAAVPGAVFHALPCGHNDCERPWRVIQQFLERRAARDP